MKQCLVLPGCHDFAITQIIGKYSEELHRKSDYTNYKKTTQVAS